MALLFIEFLSRYLKFLSRLALNKPNSYEQADLYCENNTFKKKYSDFGSPMHLEYGLLCPIAEFFISQTMPVQGGLA
jgi:hypothetical protein